MRYFTDPVFQASTIGSMLMCFSSALVGVIVVLRKRSLLGEALSHAAYPGVVLSAWIMAIFFSTPQEYMALVILAGGAVTSLLGLWLIEQLERFFHVKNDAALCFVLSVFFGFGVLIASRIQMTHALWYQTVQVFLYGQAATLMNAHVIIYSILAMMITIVVIVLYRQIEMSVFDRLFAKSVGVRIALLDLLLFVLLVLAIIIGIRSVGVVLMAGMLIAPAVAARQFTNRLFVLFILSGCFGAVSGFLGNYLSIEIPEWGRAYGWGFSFSLPTGPMILLSASAISILSLLFAPDKGVVSRCWRVMAFRRRCLGENLLKYLWKQGEGAAVSLSSLKNWNALSSQQIQLLLWYLRMQGWVQKRSSCEFVLTQDGWLRGAYMVRLHRLWEVYLVYLGQGAEKVHHSAEEMEHIITPELEKELIEILQDPHQDPHHQPIPRPKEVL